MFRVRVCLGAEKDCLELPAIAMMEFRSSQKGHLKKQNATFRDFNTRNVGN